MKRRKNAIYKGQSKRGSTGTGDRTLVDHFYNVLDRQLLPADEIEIIPPEQVNPTQDLEDQTLIMANYCVRKILPEVTGMFDWGDEVTQRLRALAPMLSSKSSREAYEAAKADHAVIERHDVDYARLLRRLTTHKAAYRDARAAAGAVRRAAEDVVPYEITNIVQHVARDADDIVKAVARDEVAYDVNPYTTEIRYVADETAAKAVRGVAYAAAKLVYRALKVCALAEDEATYNRIIDLTNEMLESL